jgi:hypothetical protein
MGALALGLSEIPAPDVSRMGLAVYQESKWARAFYDQQRERNKSHHAAVRALAFKWLRILFRCWKDRVHYDEARYTLALQRRPASKPVEFHLKTISGFTKLIGFSC